MDISDYKVHGGFRREFLVRRAENEGLAVEAVPDEWSTRARLQLTDTFWMYDYYGGYGYKSDHELDAQGDKNKPKTIGPTKAIFCILKANIGPAILYLPKAAERAGWLVFLFFIAVLGLNACRAILVLVRTRNAVETKNYNCDFLPITTCIYKCFLRIDNRMNYGELIERLTGSKAGYAVVNISI